jgi:hypothetical protein
MYVSKEFLDFLCSNKPDDFAFDVQNIFFNDSLPTFKVFIDKLNEEIAKPENTGRSTMVDIAQYLPEAILYDPSKVTYENVFVVNDGTEFSSIDAAKLYNKQIIDTLDFFSMCFIARVEKYNDTWIHPPDKPAAGEYFQKFLETDDNSWFYTYHPLTGSSQYFYGKEPVYTFVNNVRNDYCSSNNYFSIKQKVTESVDGFSALIEILNEPY